VPPIDSVDAVVGALYVCEGATLGGQIIASRIRERLGSDAPHSFFACYGDAVVARWADYRRAANAFVRSARGVDRSTRTAVEVFDWFGEVLLS
jgi:heme oxygenase